MASPSGESFTVRVLNPQNVEWQGQASAVAANNSIGPFSLLPGHSRFVSIIEGSLDIYPVGHTAPHTIPVTHGLLYCQNNQIEIFLKLPFGQDYPR